METNAERRRRKLTAICAEKGLKKVADRAGLNPASLDQIIKKTLGPPKKDGSRNPKNLGDEAARKIEAAEGLGKGWFDISDDSSASPPASPPVQPLAPANTAQAATKKIAISIEQVMDGLAQYLMEMDDDARHSAADVLRNLTHKPENHARAAAMFTTAFQLGARKAA